MEKIQTDKSQVVSKNVNGCLVHLSFSKNPNPDIQKKIEYILTDVFEKRVFGNVTI